MIRWIFQYGIWLASIITLRPIRRYFTKPDVILSRHLLARKFKTESECVVFFKEWRTVQGPTQRIVYYYHINKKEMFCDFICLTQISYLFPKTQAHEIVLQISPPITKKTSLVWCERSTRTKLITKIIDLTIIWLMLCFRYKIGYALDIKLDIFFLVCKQAL